MKISITFKEIEGIAPERTVEHLLEYPYLHYNKVYKEVITLTVDGKNITYPLDSIKEFDIL